MIRDLKRISVAAIVFIVLLRISIGWQFLYEGLWKIDSLDTANPWTSAGYLKNAQGPFRDHFRNLTGDPDDLSWVDYDTVAGGWDHWQQAFVAHYELNDEQKARLEAMLNGTSAFVASLEELPEAVEPNVQPDGRFRGSLSNVIRFDADRKRLIVSGKMHLAPHERDALIRMAELDQEATTPEAKRQNEIVRAYHKAVDDVYKRSTRYADHRQTGMAFKERLRGSLRGDPERYGYVFAAAEKARAEEAAEARQQEGAGGEPALPEPARLGKIELYRQRVKEYNDQVSRAETDYQWDHLNYLQRELQTLKSEVVGPVKALDAELKEKAELLLTDAQLAKGPVPLLATQIEWIDWLTMWSLTVIGLMLIAGFATPLAALGGAVLLISFYLVIPPWTGVPEAPGPEHSWVVNKNFIEALALLSIMLLPTGRWFGLDAIVNWMWVKLTRQKAARQPAEKRPQEPAERPHPETIPVA